MNYEKTLAADAAMKFGLNAERLEERFKVLTGNPEFQKMVMEAQAGLENMLKGALILGYAMGAKSAEKKG